MRSYVVYVDGVERGIIKARSHNAAEKKAWAKFLPTLPKRTDPPLGAVFEYTEV